MVLGGAGVAALAQYLPSVCVLGQWAPVRLQALPLGWCRWRGPRGDAVALTFDDGPSPRTTPHTLDLLDELGMRATFFVLGTLADAHPDLVSEIVARGHGVGCHGYRHERHLLRTPGWIRQDTAAAVAAVERRAPRPRWYRPPYGQLTASTVLEARRMGMEVVLWSAWGHEWTGQGPQPVLARVMRALDPGGIVLLHDTDECCPPGTARRVHAVLPMVAEHLELRGLRAVSLDQLMAAQGLPGRHNRRR